MTNMDKMMVIVALIGCGISGYAKYKGSKELVRVCGDYFEKEAKRQIARQRQKWTANESRI